MPACAGEYPHATPELSPCLYTACSDTLKYLPLILQDSERDTQCPNGVQRPVVLLATSSGVDTLAPLPVALHYRTPPD